MSRWRHRDEEGYSLVELTVCMLLTSTLLASVLIFANTFLRVETQNSSAYSELNQLIPVGTSFQRLLRTAVSPATAGTQAAPVPPFAIYTASTHKITTTTPISSTKLVFFANSGTTNGPVEVVASLSNHVFNVSTISPKAGTCPGLTTRPSTDRCKWTGSPRSLFTVYDVDNQTLPTPKTASKKKSVFKYYLLAPMNKPTGTGGYGTPATVAVTPSPFANCTAPTQVTTPHPPVTTPHRLVTVTHCPAANIESVKVDLEVKVGGGTTKVESQTVTYQLSTVSQTYTPAVG